MGIEHDAAWSALCDAAKAFASDERNDGYRTGLHSTARAYAATCAPLPSAQPRTGPSKQTREAHGMVVPFGRSKGTPIGQADTRDLEWVAQALRNSIEDAGKVRWREDNERLLGVVTSELATR